ncbi:hypothetical protein [Microbacterium sp. TNHR37B]|uniref:hypothetical protein n=1 Tax=Microbacterium sp. TNHR37B TaxID=1775956 RepID=UPI0007B27755|nr:hypothetical protein [Microbacterium sp. TNHR37B]KZE90631.1 hypothetical protein AVP41_00150 [Microbacterium sp. TNHR37B]
MDAQEPNEPSDGAQIHAELIRRRAAALRKSKRDYAIAFANHDIEPERIAEMLDEDVQTVVKLIAADGLHVCTECHYGLHVRCTFKIADPAGNIWHCECPACRT